MSDDDLRPPGYVQRYHVEEEILDDSEAQALVNGELVQALQRIYSYEAGQAPYLRSRSLEIARDVLVSVGLCPHSWQPKEVRARLDKSTLVLQSTLFTWECEWCGARQRSNTMPDHWHGLPAADDSDVIDVEAK